MKNAEKSRKSYLILFILTAVFSVIFLLVALLFLLKFMYIPMAVFAVLSAACCYAFAFLLFAFLDARWAIKICTIIEETGETDAEKIAQRLNWKESKTEKFLSICKKHGYI